MDGYPDRCRRVAMYAIHDEEAFRHDENWKDFYGRCLRKPSGYTSSVERDGRSESIWTQITPGNTATGRSHTGSWSSLTETAPSLLNTVGSRIRSNLKLLEPRWKWCALQETQQPHYLSNVMLLMNRFPGRLQFMNRKRKLTIHGERFAWHGTSHSRIRSLTTHQTHL